MPGGATSRVEPGGVESGQVDVFSGGVQHTCVRERGQVVAGDGRGHLVGVHPRHGQVQRGHGHGIAADSAAEVCDPVQGCAREAPGVQRRDPKPGGLLEAGLGEEHAPGELAELRHCPGPQP